MKINLNSRFKSFLRNNLKLIPNLIRGDSDTRLYVVRIWFLNNLSPLIRLSKKIRKSNIFPKNEVTLLAKDFSLRSEIIQAKLIMDKVDVRYINLKHRLDRNQEILNMFYKLGIRRFQRFNAIDNEIGILGCVLSHKKVLEEWLPDESNLLMVCEDDLSIICSLDELKSLLVEFSCDRNLDILCLSHNNFDEHPYSDKFSITSDTQTTSCYIIKPYMKEVLIKNFNLSIKLLETGVDRQYRVALDQVWKLLQKKYNFAIPRKRSAYQRESYSDIEQKIVDYKV